MKDYAKIYTEVFHDDDSVTVSDTGLRIDVDLIIAFDANTIFSVDDELYITVYYKWYNSISTGVVSVMALPDHAA